MLVVIPFHTGDELACVANLQLCQLMDGKNLHHALISCESTTDPTLVTHIAKDAFARVDVFRYDPYKGPNQWPMPANWAFQQAARHVCEKWKTPWLWMEADATPCKKGWLNILQDEYNVGKKPFMGHVVDGMGHMNGTGCYPHDVHRFCPEAMFCREGAFDVVLGRCVRQFCHPINHLIGHVWKVNAQMEPVNSDDGTIATFPDQAMVDKLVPATNALFHRCKDGSLAKRLIERYGNPSFVTRLKELWTIPSPQLRTAA